MDQAYHFLVQDPATGQMVSNDKVLPAPQANMLAAVSKGLMSDPANQPWLLYGIGGLVAVLLFMAGVPMLAFALGMYLPLSINLAVLAGAAVVLSATVLVAAVIGSGVIYLLLRGDGTPNTQLGKQYV